MVWLHRVLSNKGRVLIPPACPTLDLFAWTVRSRCHRHSGGKQEAEVFLLFAGKNSIQKEVASSSTIKYEVTPPSCEGSQGYRKSGRFTRVTKMVTNRRCSAKLNPVRVFLIFLTTDIILINRHQSYISYYDEQYERSGCRKNPSNYELVLLILMRHPSELSPRWTVRVPVLIAQTLKRTAFRTERTARSRPRWTPPAGMA